LDAVPGDPGGAPATPPQATTGCRPASKTAAGRATTGDPGHSGHDQAGGLDRLRRQYPRWRIWRGQATGDYWALPPRDHPAQRGLIAAGDLNELARRLAHAEGQHDR
jgi:hypothetical protein